jgi:hypothetical protein
MIDARLDRRRMRIADYVAITTTLVALATLWKTLTEYIRQGTERRADRFLAMRTRLRTNPDFLNICELLETDDPSLRDVPLIQKDNFIGFFEELALLWNSKIFSDEVVYYMFGYFALACWRSENFWSDLNRDQVLWSHFRDFVERLGQVQASYTPSQKAYRL